MSHNSKRKAEKKLKPPPKKRQKILKLDTSKYSLFKLTRIANVYPGLVTIEDTKLVIPLNFSNNLLSTVKIIDSSGIDIRLFDKHKKRKKKTLKKNLGSKDTKSATDGKSAEIQPNSSAHRESFLQMEKNMYAYAQFILHPEERIKKHQQQIKKFQEMQRTPLNGNHNNIRIRQHGALLERYEQEKLRVITEGIERKVYEARMVQFHETWNQLPSERRQNEDQFLNFYCQFFQMTDTIAEITTRKICPKCKCKLSNSKRESDWDCEMCGLYETYLTPKTTVRIAYNNFTNNGITSESKTWTTFISSMPQFIEGETPFTSELKDELIEYICSTKHTAPFMNIQTKQKSAERAIAQALRQLDKSELCDWAARFLYELQEDSEKCQLMSPEEHETLSTRLKYIQLIFNNYHIKNKLELCDPRFAYRQICILYRWQHLFSLFPITRECSESDEEKSKWDTLIDFVSKHDVSSVWRLPELPV